MTYEKALAAVHQLDYAPHLEVETYTWNVLPGETTPDLVSGMTSELTATYALLDEIANPNAGFSIATITVLLFAD